MLLHINPTRQRGKRTGSLAGASGWYMTFFAAGVIGGAVQRQQVMAVQIDEAFEHLAALQAPEDLAERGSQVRRIDRIENGPHLGVGGDTIDPIDGAEVIVWVVAAVVEGQQGWVLEREHGKGRHQGIGQGDFDLAGPRVRTDLWPQLFSDVNCIALWVSSEKILTRLYSILH